MEGGSVRRCAIFNREDRQRDVLADIEEWWRDGVECISRTDENNLFIESDALLWIEDLEQGCRRTAVIA